MTTYDDCDGGDAGGGDDGNDGLNDDDNCVGTTLR